MVNETVTINGKEYTKEDVDKAKETAKKAWKTLAETVSNIICGIVEGVQRIIDNIVERKREKKHNYNWYVPKNTVKNHQVLNKKPLVAHIRNHI